MVAKITVPATVSRALNYNEKKVQKGVAECIHAGNFLKDVRDMNFQDKLTRFQNLIALNTSTTNTLHISLNFEPSEKFTDDKLREIADNYMQRIGFADQPYLVYRHDDAGHPHCHIVTTNIQSNGKRIDTYKIGERKSRPACEAIEKEFGLIVAKGRNSRRDKEIKPLDVQKVIYGKSETRRGIINVLDGVLKQYKYTSLPELNAILAQYNVLADRGKEGERIYSHRGLNYRVLDEQGRKQGVPIKASSIYNNPGLKYLEQRFGQNKESRDTDLKKLRVKINWALAQNPTSLREFRAQLEEDRVKVVIRQNDQGRIYGLTFIDNEHRVVANGRDIGKEYAAKGILESLGIAQQDEKSQQQETAWEIGKGGIQGNKGSERYYANPDHKAEDAGRTTDQEKEKDKTLYFSKVGKITESGSHTPPELTQDETKKKKRKRHL
jgi:hypothetical protein